MKKEYDLQKLKKRPGKVQTHSEADKVAINIRLDAVILNDVKNEAARMGLPYQTLINSILHRFTTGELIDQRSKKASGQ